VRYSTPEAFRRALETRLLAAAREAGVPVVRLRKLVVFDRLLARLLAVSPDRWILKGALALDLRLGTRARTTRDMDLARWDTEAAATVDLLAAQAVDLNDYFMFRIERTDRLEALVEGVAVRYHVTAELAGRRFEDAILDIGFGGALVTSPEALRGTELLTFAGIEPIEVPVLPLEQHVAEKVHAYTRSYEGGQRSTRVKDLVDLVLIRSSAEFLAQRLREAIEATFGYRDTHPVPAELPSPPPEWATAYRRMAAGIGIDPDVLVGYRLATTFLDPVLGGVLQPSALWDPTEGVWRAPA